MDMWRRFGKAVGSKMAVIAPICVALGVTFPQAFQPIQPIVPVMFAIMTFQGSLNNTFSRLIEVFRHPAPMLAILGVTIVWMPVLSYLFGNMLFGSDPQLVLGIVLEYSVPIGVVSIMWVGIYDGDGALGLACVLVSTVLSPFTIPLTLKLLLGATVEVDVEGMMVSMLFMIALPAIAGMLVNELTHGWGRERLSPTMSPACRILLILIITSNSTEISDYMHNLTGLYVEVFAFILVFAVSGFFWGTILARVLHVPDSVSVTMGFDCGMRNISSGAVIAAAYFPGEAMLPVIGGTLFQQILAALYGSFTRRMALRSSGGEPTSAGSALAGPAPAGPASAGPASVSELEQSSEGKSQSD